MEDEKILIRNASQVVTCSGFEAKKGKAMSDVGIIEDGAVAVSDGIITHVGPTDEVLRQVDVGDYLEVDASGRALLPGFVDRLPRGGVLLADERRQLYVDHGKGRRDRQYDECDPERQL